MDAKPIFIRAGFIRKEFIKTVSIRTGGNVTVLGALQLSAEKGVTVAFI
jgi:hypothetical protein